MIQRDDHGGIAVLTISDTRTPETDTGGDVVEETMRGTGHEVVARGIVRDEATSIRTQLTDLLARSDVDAVVTTGGTGISGRDTTYEVVERMIEKVQRLGYNIDGDAILAQADFGTIGRPHVARALIEIGAATDVSDAFDRFLKAGRPGYIPRDPFSPEDAVALLVRHHATAGSQV